MLALIFDVRSVIGTFNSRQPFKIIDYVVLTIDWCPLRHKKAFLVKFVRAPHHNFINVIRVTRFVKQQYLNWSVACYILNLMVKYVEYKRTQNPASFSQFLNANSGFSHLNQIWAFYRYKYYIRIVKFGVKDI